MVLHRYKLSTFGETKRLTGIDETLVEPILFLEKLYVYDENGKRIGRFSVKIDKEEEDPSGPKILYVHISNRAFIGGKLSESVVTGTVTPKLRTLEEIRYERTETVDTGTHERFMFLLRENTKYYLSVTNKIGNVQSQNRTTMPFVEALGLVGESANAVLLRILATKGYEGILCMKTVLSNGKRCRNYYVSKLSEQVVNRRKMQVLVVYRNVTDHKKCNVTMTLALTRAGQIIYLFWSNSKCFLHVDPDAEILPHHFEYEDNKLHTRWHKDVQLHSLYLDQVDKRKMICRSYKYENEPLKRVVSDFVEYVLFLKPADIVHFAIQYFTAFGHRSREPGQSQVFRSQSQAFSEDLGDIEEEGEKELDDCFDEMEDVLFGET